jgi:hypothetical protein
MRDAIIVIAWLAVSAAAGVQTSGEMPTTTKPLRVLVLTGGHDFEEWSFFEIFEAMRGITWTHVRFLNGAEEYLTTAKSRNYDVAVFYDMHQQREPQWQSWLSVLEQGKPTVFLHHSFRFLRGFG